MNDSLISSSKRRARTVCPPPSPPPNSSSSLIRAFFLSGAQASCLIVFCQNSGIRQALAPQWAIHGERGGVIGGCLKSTLKTLENNPFRASHQANVALISPKANPFITMVFHACLPLISRDRHEVLPPDQACLLQKPLDPSPGSILAHRGSMKWPADPKGLCDA